MKKGLIGIAVMALILGIALIPAKKISAYEFSICHHCDGTGKFHCSSCNDRGTVTCDLCMGKAKWSCPYCSGKGYEICPSCMGDTYLRNGDGEIPPDTATGTCGQCGGTGKLPCVNCRETGFNVCTRCDGKGYQECLNIECINNKANKGLCNYCKGTGYLGDGLNFKEEWNDGVTNTPKEGDLIWRADRTTYRYHKNPTGKEAAKAAEELESYKNEAVKELDKVLNKYSKTLYSSEGYKKLKKTYEKAVKAVENASDKAGTADVFYKYIGSLTDIRPAVLDKYKDNCIAKLRKAYSELAKTYWNDTGFSERKFEVVLGDGIDSINNATTKSKVKKIMKATLKKLVY